MPRGIPNRKKEVVGEEVPHDTGLGSIQRPVQEVTGDPPSGERVGEYRILFLQAVRDILPAVKLFSDDRLIQKIGKTKVDDHSLEFFGYLEDGAGSLTKNQKLALANQLLRCLRKYILATGLPFTLKVLLDNLSMLDHAVNQCYPGYYESKLLKYTILPIQNEVA